MQADQPRSGENIEEQAALWLETLKSADANRRGAFATWLRQSPDHVVAFLEMSLLADELARVSRAGLIDIDALLAEGAPDNVIPLAATLPLKEALAAEAGLPVTVHRAGVRRRRSAMIGTACATIGLVIVMLLWHIRQH
jgi:ferric-dicitrate binding protein FerR (iron transport regulator)